LSLHSSSGDRLATEEGSETEPHGYAPGSTDDSLSRPPQIGRYVVLDTLGMGAMGIVYSAYDPKLDRKVALKVLRQGKSEDSHQRMLLEAKTLAQLNHPNVVDVYDVDEHDGRAYIALEFVQGLSFKQWLREQRRPWKQVLRAFVAAGRGLAAAHEAGIVHRDIKPGNLLMGDDRRPRVADFGLAKASDKKREDSLPPSLRPVETGEAPLDLTQSGRTVGTPAYMAPEQHLHSEVGPLTDQFSFCVSLYEGLYGQLPYRARTSAEQLERIVNGRIEEPPADAHVPTRLLRIIQRGLEPRPDARFVSMHALLAELTRHPARRARMVGAIGLVLASTAGIAYGAYGASASNASLCDGSETKMEGIWGEPTKAQLHEAFAAVNKPFAADAAAGASARLDQLAAEWVATYRSVCEATHVEGEQSTRLLDLRMGCLERRRSQMNATVEVLLRADAGVAQHAVKAAAQLDGGADCASLSAEASPWDMPEDPTVQREIARVESGIDAGNALYHAGRYDEAVSRLAELNEGAVTLDYPPTYTRAVLALAEAQASAGDVEAAEAGYKAAIGAAAAAGDARRESIAWSDLIFLVGRTRSQHDTALAWALPANLALQRAGNEPELRKMLLRSLGAVHMAQGEHDAALFEFSEATRLLEDLHGPDSIKAVSEAANMGTLLGQMGLLEASEERLKRALDVGTQQLGPHHPILAFYLTNLGNVAQVRGDHDGAKDFYERAYQVRVAALGAEHPHTATSMAMLGMSLTDLGAVDRAVELLEGAGRIKAATYGEEATQVQAIRNNLARALSARGDHEEARRLHESALGVFESKYKPGHQRIINTLAQLCAELGATHDPDAIKYCERHLDALEVRHGKYSPRLLPPLDQLVELHEAAGRRTQAQRLRVRASGIGPD
jgi:tetratricopeptide (TPR) repeat protein/predicted Ser/Thr protein kinase